MSRRRSGRDAPCCPICDARPSSRSTRLTEPSPNAPRPIAATIAVVIHGDRVLLVRRAHPPDAGLWGFPGGKIDLGEAIQAAAIRELREETGIEGAFERVLTAVDAFDHGPQGQVRQHFILVVAVCRWISGEPVAGDDALEARWFGLDELEGMALAMSFGVADVARQAAEGNGAHRAASEKTVDARPNSA